MVKVREDLTDRTFGRLTVKYQTEDYVDSKGKHYACWLCECECKKQTIVRQSDLKRNKSLSCGCLNREIMSVMMQELMKKYNDYEIQEDYVIMYTQKGEPFYVDLEDFWRVRDICWHINDDGYVAGKYKKKIVLLHRFVMNCPDNILVDHIHGKKSRIDNRKENLRIATRSQNNTNVGLRKNNTSGTSGICFKKEFNKWCARISYNKKRIHLGYFENYNDAVKARKEAEEKYFGEWSYDNSQRM